MNINKETIFVDIDETTARSIEDSVYPFVNTKFWTNFTFETTRNYRDIFWGILKKDWKVISLPNKIEIFKSAVSQDIWKNLIRPVSWSVEKILELSEWYNIDILTARHPKLLQYTKNWAKSKYNWSINRLFSSNFYHGWKATKWNICKQEWVKIMIEDDMDYAIELAKEWVKVFLLRKPWNEQRKEKHKNIVRVEWWSDIIL